jgi:hypothetical protein
MGVVVIGGWDTKVKTLTSPRCVGDAQYHRDRRAGTLVIRVPKMTAEEVALARRMYESGHFFLHEIAKATGKCTASIAKRAQRDGWERSPIAASLHAMKFSAKQSRNGKLPRG